MFEGKKTKNYDKYDGNIGIKNYGQSNISTKKYSQSEI